MKQLLMVSVLMPLLVLADTEVVGGVTWTYTINDGKAQVGMGSSYSPAITVSTSGAITIPLTLGGCPVTSIGDYAFCYCSKLTSVTIPSSVTNIGNNAFFCCSGLTTVTIPSSVTSIGCRAFSSCGIASVSISEGVTNIGKEAFWGCGKLTSVTIPSSVTSIGDMAFENCSQIESVKISDLSAWCRIAFNYAVSNPLCYGAKLILNDEEVTDLLIPNDVTSIGSCAFYNCASLKSVMIPSGVTRIGSSAFSGCKGVAEVTIPSSVMNIDMETFSGCSGLVSVAIPSSVTNIGYCAFYNCSGLMSVTIPSSVMSIGARAFYGCGGLGDGVVIVDDCVLLVNGVCPSSIALPFGVRLIAGGAFYNCSGLTSVTMPEGVTGIGDGAFYGCSGLTAVTIPSSVTSIGSYAFYGCSTLKSITIPDGVTTIGNGVFSDCIELVSVTIPEDVTSIGHDSFYGCRGLTSVMIPKGVTSIGDVAFEGCSKLDIVYVAKGDAERVKDLYKWPWTVTFVEMVDVTFDLSNRGIRHSGGELHQRLIAGETAVVPVVCSVDGWRFVGWDGDATRPIVSNTTFNAVYEPIVYTIGYENTKGVINPNPTTYTVTNEIVFASLPDADEYWSRGWEPARIEVGTTGDLVVTAKWDRIQGVAEAAGDQNRGWVSSGDADWFVTWNDAKSKYVVRSGEICDGQTSTLETVVTNGGTVSFEVKVSCEGMQRGQRTDGLSILVDGVEKFWLDGEVDWTNITIAVAGEGEHRIKWKYSKDVECAAGEDCAYLANFKFYHQVVVSFDGGGATVGEVPSDIVSYNGGTITLPEVGTMKKINHSFAGWSDGVEVYQPGAIFVLGDVPPTFTAVWSRKELDSPVIEVPARYETERTRVTITADEGATIRYTIDGTDPIENGLVYQGPFEVAGSLTIRVVAVRDDWYDSAVVEASTVRAPWGYAECLNCEDVGFTSGGDSAWVRDLLVSHDGMASVRSGKIGNSETNWLEATVIGAGTLSFWWQASAEMWRQQFVDCGTVWIDGVEQAGVKIGDHDDWRQELIAVKGGARHTIRWVYSKDVEDAVPFEWEDCIWLDEVKWTPVLPSVVDDADATVTGDAETGFVVKPSEGMTAVEVTIPQDVDAAKVTVEVSPKVASVKPNGAKVKIVSGGADITEFLNVPAADGCGVVDLTKATVKEEIVKEAMDPAKGAEIELDAANPTLITPNTRVGLFYQLREGTTLEGMSNGDSTIGDGNPWKPEIKVKGGNSAFYSIGVGKGE